LVLRVAIAGSRVANPRRYSRANGRVPVDAVAPWHDTRRNTP
jgi:hypothetical protein